MAAIKALVIAEHDNAGVRPATLNTVTAASQLGGPVDVLIAGSGSAGAATAAAAIAGVSKVLHADAAIFAHGLAENVAAQVLALASGYSHILFARPPRARTSRRASPPSSTSGRSPTSPRSMRRTPSSGRSTPATRSRRCRAWTR